MAHRFGMSGETPERPMLSLQVKNETIDFPVINTGSGHPVLPIDNWTAELVEEYRNSKRHFTFFSDGDLVGQFFGASQPREAEG